VGSVNEKQLQVLEIIEKNSRISEEVLAKMVGLSIDEIKKIVKELEQKNIILSYSTLIDWAKVQKKEHVTAMIDVKVTPKRDVGFDNIAERIYRFQEVKAVYLMSGAYDLSVMIEGESMSEVAYFVSEKLSTLDSVVSTTTHFIMKKYKHDGVVYDEGDQDKRIVVSP
jgi:DNA-binding Lrp family transcriptional regulator